MELMMGIIYVLLFAIFALAMFSVMQLKMAGIKVKDFWSFIEANQMLDKLYNATSNRIAAIGILLMAAEFVYIMLDAFCMI